MLLLVYLFDKIEPYRQKLELFALSKLDIFVHKNLEPFIFKKLDQIKKYTEPVRDKNFFPENSHFNGIPLPSNFKYCDLNIGKSNDAGKTDELINNYQKLYHFLSFADEIVDKAAEAGIYVENEELFDTILENYDKQQQHKDNERRNRMAENRAKLLTIMPKHDS